MARSDFESLRVYNLAEVLADEIWETVKGWERFARDTVGGQIVWAVDSIGANIAEGWGRGSFQDNRRFIRMARGSQKETQHFLRRACKRKLPSEEQIDKIKPLVETLAPLNAYLNSIGRVQDKRAQLLTTDHGPRTTYD